MDRKIAAVLFVLVIAVVFNVSLMNEVSRLHKENSKLSVALDEVTFQFELCKQIVRNVCQK